MTTTTATTDGDITFEGYNLLAGAAQQAADSGEYFQASLIHTRIANQFGEGHPRRAFHVSLAVLNRDKALAKHKQREAAAAPVIPCGRRPRGCAWFEFFVSDNAAAPGQMAGAADVWIAAGGKWLAGIGAAREIAAQVKARAGYRVQVFKGAGDIGRLVIDI
jgi:hypothetical protein